MLPLNWLKHRSSMVRDDEVLQTSAGIGPVKLLLLALRAIRFSIAFHVVDGNCPANKLLEMFSTCRGRAGVEGSSSWSVPLSWLKLTSRMVMLLDDTNPSGRRPDNELWERLRCCSPVIPSQLQQSVPLRHEVARPPSCESSFWNWRRECFSCCVQELVGEAKQISSTRATPKEEKAIMRGKRQTVGEDLKEQERPPFEKETVGEDLKEQEKARI